MISNVILRNIRLIALENSYSNSIEWFVEKACRYYSKTYNTPLKDVRSMNPLEVVQVFMEDDVMNLSPEEYQEAKSKLVKPHRPMLDPEQFIEDEEEELSDDEWVAQQMADVATKEAASKSKKKATDNESAQAALAAVKDLYKGLNLDTPSNLEGDIKFGKDE